ncbi:MAG: PAS domain S-box protein [Spirochaetia bacterium]|jgi:PAS domain S-box-containing protein
MKVPPLFSSLFPRSRKKRVRLVAVQRSLFRWLLSLFLLFGLPAVIFGILQSVQQDRWPFAVVYAFLYLLALLILLLAKRLRFGLAAGVFIVGMFALSVAVLVRLGLSGAGVPLLIGCCMLSMAFFDLRGAIGAIGACLVAFAIVGTGMVLGFVPVKPGSQLSSLSALSWFDMGAVFLLLAVGMVIAQQVLRSHLENSLDQMEENAGMLEESNRQLLGEIHSRRTAEEALRRSEEQYRLIVENAHDAIFIAQDGMIKFPNQRLTEIIGYENEEITATPFTHFIHPDDRAWVVDNHQRRLRGESIPPVYSFRLINKRGEVIWIELGAVLFSWEGRPASLNFARDITVQKRLEAHSLQGQKLEAIGTLAGGIAHDFNNLLQVIHGYAELLVSDAQPDQHGYQELTEIQRAAARGGELARQLLTFSRKMESALKPTDLNAVVQKARTLLERVIPKMIAIELQLSPDLKLVNADPGQMEQVLMNLAINARDAMPQGGTLTIMTANCALDEEYCRSYPDLRPGEYARLCVTDTGEGITPEALPHIFEPFYTTKQIGKGTGLGLSMVYGIIHNHYGAVTCESKPGAGARFMVHLPVAAAGPATRDSREAASPPHGTEKILLVDDEKSLRTLGERILRRAGYEVRTAIDGESALEAYQKEPGRIDLVILDLIMPGMGGQRCLGELLRIDPGAKVLVASGFVPDGETWDAREAGAAGLVRKPFQIGTMLEMVRQALDTREAPGGFGNESAASSKVPP